MSEIGFVQEALYVGDHRAPGEELDAASTQHDRVRFAERPAGMVGRLAQVRRPRLRTEVRPKVLDHLVAHEPVAAGEAQEGHELLRATCRPVGLDDLAAAEPHTEAPEHLDPDVVWRWLHDGGAVLPVAGDG